ncbi:MAG: hypothetical protein KatS3mg065_0690 [Chloroflexota bacterium]|nr:MAG: hypothetical protein KatS3mg065_0690 [Chloroflexota bacterium]
MPSSTGTGLPLEDMEFYQFHPTGIYKLGILLSEAARGEGGILRNDAGERFMERYAPTLKDLARGTIVSRAIYQEIREGRGIGGRDYVYLDFTHLGRAGHRGEAARHHRVRADLPRGGPAAGAGARSSRRPTTPWAASRPTSSAGVRDDVGTVVPGLYAAGECACVSVHGANRLGTNSLVDLLVFGRRAGRRMARDVQEADLPEIPATPTEPVRASWPPFAMGRRRAEKWRPDPARAGRA